MCCDRNLEYFINLQQQSTVFNCDAAGNSFTMEYRTLRPHNVWWFCVQYSHQYREWSKDEFWIVYGKKFGMFSVKWIVFQGVKPTSAVTSQNIVCPLLASTLPDLLSYSNPLCFVQVLSQSGSTCGEENKSSIFQVDNLTSELIIDLEGELFPSPKQLPNQPSIVSNVCFCVR